MRIPTNSNFTKEMSKRLQRIINPQTTLEELQNLQEEMNMINPVDTHLQKQVSQLKGNKHEPKKNVSNARAVRQEYTKGKSIAGTVAKSETEKKEVGLADTSS